MLVSCNYDKKNTNPWKCVGDMNAFPEAKNVLTDYPKSLNIGTNNLVLTLPVGCNFDNKTKNLKCGDNNTLKLSQKGEIIAIKRPPIAGWIMVSGEKQNGVNPKMFAENIVIEHDGVTLTPFSFKVDENLLAESEKQMIKSKPSVVSIGYKNYYVEKFSTKHNDYKSEYKNLVFKSSTIDPSYQRKWTLFEALREWFANAHDVTDKTGDTRIYQEDGNWVIEYSSDAVLRLKHLVVLGSHEQRKDKITIGVFGEGITLGSLVLARLGIPVKIEAIGKTYYPVLKYDDDLESELLTIYHTESNRTHGTKLTFIGIPDFVMEQAKRAFLFNRPNEYDVLFEADDYGQILEFRDKINRLAVRDLIIESEKTKSLKTLFSYNFMDLDEDLLNRDRDVVGADKVQDEISRKR